MTADTYRSSERAETDRVNVALRANFSAADELAFSAQIALDWLQENDFDNAVVLSRLKKALGDWRRSASPIKASWQRL